MRICYATRNFCRDYVVSHNAAAAASALAASRRPPPVRPPPLAKAEAAARFAWRVVRCFCSSGTTFAAAAVDGLPEKQLRTIEPCNGSIRLHSRQCSCSCRRRCCCRAAEGSSAASRGAQRERERETCAAQISFGCKWSVHRRRLFAAAAAAASQ